MLKTISPENLLKFLVNRDTIRNNLSFQLTRISGTVPTLKDKKIHNLSLTRLGRKTKLPMQEPIETVIIRAQQSFEVAGGMNPVQTELKDNGVLNLLKKHKNVAYNLTPLGILFPASLRNNTRQIFIMCKELNDVKKSLINGKVYGLLGIIDLEKINNWEEIKGQSIWINATLVEHPFTTKILNDLLNFSIYLLNANNNGITFPDSEKKRSMSIEYLCPILLILVRINFPTKIDYRVKPHLKKETKELFEKSF